MINNKREFLTIGLLALMFLAGTYAYAILPEKVPIHWNAEGRVDGYGPKWIGAFMLPVIALLVYALFVIIPKIEVRKENVNEFYEKHGFGLKLMLVLFVLVIYAASLLSSLGYEGHGVMEVVFPALALLFLYVGHIMKDVKSNFFFGIRTPWTLSSEKVWKRVNEMGGNLFMALGVILLASSWLLPPQHIFWLLLASLLAGVLGLTIYSYVLYKEEAR